MPPQPKALLNDRLVAAISHPTRMHAMCVFWDREASPREVAAEIGEPLNNVTYHVKQLLELGWIELVAQRPAGGGRVMEHIYKATHASEFDEDEFESLGKEGKDTLNTAILNKMSSDLAEALLSGTFSERDDNQLTRIPIEVDEAGWEETKEVLDRALEELLEVKARVANRAAASGETTFPTKVEIIHFMSPPPRGGAA
ncbi:MAG TPA: winged helix-turn-helix domain-containing protein [Solirubrobacterales bacterium]